MKALKITVALILFGANFIYAQEVNYNNEVYTVKGQKVYKDGEDQTEVLTASAQEEIKTRFERLEEQERELREAEREQRKAEKKQRQAEKELKHEKQKAKKIKKSRANLEKAEARLEKEQKKFQRLQKKGKIDVEDLSKWDDKMLKLKEQVTKAERRLKRA